MKTRIAIGWATFRIYRQCNPPAVAFRMAWSAVRG